VARLHMSRSRSAEIHIGSRAIGRDHPTYFIADVASNHDGELARARELIWLAAGAGADAVKFQHFHAEQIVSDRGFRALGAARGHQAAWPKPVFDTYRQYELDRDWTAELAATARAAGLAFLTTPYDVDAIAHVRELAPALKVGSGDIDWLAFIRAIAAEGKPVLLATGACDMIDVERAVATVLAQNPELVVMQCNTNYTGSLENFRHLNLRVLQLFAQRWPALVLGLSDHTPGHAGALGAVALGARVIEKHFTDENARVGPDHAFAMTPPSWSEMVVRVRELEQALGDGVKRVQENERETAILQRRCVRLARDMPALTPLCAEDLVCLRPAEPHALSPARAHEAIGRPLARAMARGEALRAEDLVSRC
jgi:sialic acid synthase SpsE